VLLLWLLLSASGLYYLAALYASLGCRPRRQASPFSPPVSVLKPARGREPDLLSCARSQAAQRYPDFEILFAVSDPADPAIAEVRALAGEFPRRRIEVFLTDRRFGPNDKVNGLERLRRESRSALLVINDSDIRVDPDYLRRVVAPLADPSIGLVTSLYRGAPQGGLPALLEALWISTDFQVGALVARLLGIRFALGATLALRREDLDRAGGFAPLAGYLADDYQLGRWISDRGLRIELAEGAVETVLPRQGWGESWRRRIRWGRTLRACRPWGYAGTLVTFAAPLGAAAVAVDPSLWPLATACLALRLAAAFAIGARLLGDPAARRYFFLIPLADLASFLVWAGSLFGRGVVWGGQRFRLTGDGRLHPSGASG